MQISLPITKYFHKHTCRAINLLDHLVSSMYKKILILFYVSTTCFAAEPQITTQEFQAMIADLNKSTPVILDKISSLKKYSAEENDTLVFNYEINTGSYFTLVADEKGVSTNYLNDQVIRKFGSVQGFFVSVVNQLNETSIRKTCTNPKRKATHLKMIAKGIKIKHSYSDEYGNNVTSHMWGPNICDSTNSPSSSAINHDNLIHFANKLNAALPVKIDALIEWDNVLARSSNVLELEFTLHTHKMLEDMATEEGVDIEKIKLLAKERVGSIEELYKNTVKGMGEFIKQEICAIWLFSGQEWICRSCVFKYTFYDENSNFIATNIYDIKSCL